MQLVRIRFLCHCLGILAGPAELVIILLAFKIRIRNPVRHLPFDIILIIGTALHKGSQFLPGIELQIDPAGEHLEPVVNPLLGLHPRIFLVHDIFRDEFQGTGIPVRKISVCPGLVQIRPREEGVLLTVLPIQAGSLSIIAEYIEKARITLVQSQETVPPVQGIALVALDFEPCGDIRSAGHIEVVAGCGSLIIHTAHKSV